MSELISSLSGSDALLLLETINNCMSCKTEEDFSSLFSRIRELFPFDFAGSILGSLDSKSGLVLTHGINISFPEVWMREYESNNYFHSDLLTLETFRTYTLKHWSYLTKDHSLVPKEIKTLNMDLGVREAYAHGSRPSTPGKDGSIFCFASPLMKQEDRTVAILEYLIPHLHLALTNVYRNTPPQKCNIVLSRREIEVLNWLKLGKSSWDISVILSISEHTVNYHVYNIMGKLNASNRPHALAIATRLGLISFD